jgi:PAS domain S-box-containing protein
MAVAIRGLGALPGLGPRTRWPRALRDAVSTCLDQGFASLVWWGPSLVQFYNDAALAVLRGRHPAALGAPAATAWGDAWASFAPHVETVVGEGRAVTRVTLRLPAPTLEDGADAEARAHAGDATPATLTFSAFPLRDESGVVRGMGVIVLDRLDEPRAARPIDRSRSGLHRALRAGRMAYWDWDPATDRLQGSPALGEVFGLLPGEVATSGAPVRRAIHEDDRVRHLALVEAAVAAPQDSSWHSEFRIVRARDGRIAWLEEHASAHGDVGSGRRTVTGLVWDITERKREESDLRAAHRRRQFLLDLNERLRPLAAAEAIQRAAMHALGRFLGVARVGYAEDQADGQTIVVTGNYVDGVPGIEGRYRYDDYGPELHRAFLEGRTVVRPDIPHHLGLTADEREAHAALQIGSSVNVPLVKSGRLVCVLFVHDREPRAWTRDEIETVEAVAERTWAASRSARAEHAQQASETMFRALFEAMEEGFAVVDVVFDDAGRAVDYWYVQSNAAHQRLTGPRGEAGLVGRRVREVHPGIESAWVERLGRVALEGEQLHVENFVASLDRWFEVKAYRIGGASSRRVGLLFNDVTERRRADEALRVHAAGQGFLLRLGDALTSLSDAAEIQRRACALVGAQFGVKRVSLAEIEGDEAVVRSDFVDGVVSLVGRFPCTGFGEPMLAAWRRGETVRLDDGAGRPVVAGAGGRDAGAGAPRGTPTRTTPRATGLRAFVGVPLTRDGRWAAVLLVHDRAPRCWTDAEVALLREVADRTWAALERARAEAAVREHDERLRVVAELVPDLLWAADPTGRVEWRNERLAARLDIPSDAPQDWEQAVHPEDLLAVRAKWEHAVRTSQPYASEHRMRVRGGEFRWFLVRAEALLDDAGRVRQWLGAALDVHAERAARELLERRVRERTRDLEGAARLRQQLLARIDSLQDDERRRIARELHDALGQQLSAVMLAVSQAARKCDGRAREDLNRVETLLAGVDADLDRIVFQLRPTGLEDNGLAEGVAAHAATWSRLSGVAVDVVTRGMADRRLPANVESAVFRVVQEALTNVAKHAHATRLGITLECTRRTLVVTVEDNGVGFDPEARANTPTSAPSWGLVGMKERIEALQGEFVVEGSLGNGTTVLVRVPLGGDA